MPHPPRLLARADDAGSFRCANTAILETCVHGIVRNVSLMAPGPEIEHAAELLAGRREICFGLHATLNDEWIAPRFRPCADPHSVSGLLDSEGRFLPRPVDLHERGIPETEILLELDAQLDRLRQLDFDIRYLDTHMGWDWMHPPGREDERISRRLAEWAHERGLLYPAARAASLFRASVRDTSGIDTLAAWIAALPEGAVALNIEHPAVPDAEISAANLIGNPEADVARDRDLQRRRCLSPAIRDAMDQRPCLSIRFDEWI